jgi:hypothetical protein
LPLPTFPIRLFSTSSSSAPALRLTFALDVADLGTVALVTKKDRSESNTNWAQGGIAGVMAPDDSFDLHVQDTLVAGAGLCHRDAVEVLVREGPDRIRELIDFGARFNTEVGPEGKEQLALTREGGHSRRRIAYNADLTGREIERALVAQANAHPAISVFEHHSGIDFAKSPDDERHVCGVYVLDTADETINTFSGPPRRDARHRRLRPRVHAHDQSGHCHGRWGSHGVSGRRARCEHGVYPVPPDHAVSSRGPFVSDLRGRARRGRHFA